MKRILISEQQNDNNMPTTSSSSNLMNNSNHLCILDGNYHQIVRKTVNNLQIKDLVESYLASEVEVAHTGDLNIIYTKDGGADLVNQLINNCSAALVEGLETSSSTTDTTTTTTNANECSHVHTTTSSQLAKNNTNKKFICFIINDFDQNDQMFAQLEEIQLKLNNLTAQNSILDSSTKKFVIFGWPVLHYCVKNEISLKKATEVERPLYCKLMSGCIVAFTGFKKENKQTVGHCIKLVHYMGGSVRKDYNKKITHLIVKSTISEKYKIAQLSSKSRLLTEDWIVEAWKYRDDVNFDVNGEEFVKKFSLKALYSLRIAFYGFTPEETAHMREVTIENGGTPVSDLSDTQCTHIVVNDQEVRSVGGEDAYQAHANSSTGINNSSSSTPTTTGGSVGSKSSHPIYLDMNAAPFNSTRAFIVCAEWFWTSIQICARATECQYEFVKLKEETNRHYKLDSGRPAAVSSSSTSTQPSPKRIKRIKLSSDNLLAGGEGASNSSTSHVDSPANSSGIRASNTSKKNNSSNNLLNDYENSPGVGNTTINASTHHASSRLSSDRLLFNNINKSTLSNNNNLSTSASLLDATNDENMSIDSPYEKKRDSIHDLLNSASSNGGGAAGVVKTKVNKRSHRIFELYETETRFVSILETIIKLFKQPIESPDQAAGPVLDQTEIKEIFGNLPPIYEVHGKIKEKLEKLVSRLGNINTEDNSLSVGEIYLENADFLLKTYPPFVNFYEKTKEAILNCDKQKPRFHAFLKIAQSKAECGRQTLVELLIRPVQRLPSTLLLLDDILKETPRNHRDHELLTRAIASLREVMAHINEDKRKTENQLTMFNLINDIENCPATLLSSHRTFLKKLDAYEITNETPLCKKGAQLTFFLFSDCLEICRPKSQKGQKSPTSSHSRPRTPTKSYKHTDLFMLNNVTQVCDILQNSEDTNLFGIMCRQLNDKEKLYTFRVLAPSSSSSSSNGRDGSSSSGGSSRTLTSQTSVMINHFNNKFSSHMSCSTINMSSSSSAHNMTLSGNSTMMYASTTNLSMGDESLQAINEKKEYIRLLAQGICNVKCLQVNEVLCSVEAHQIQAEVGDSGSSKIADKMKKSVKGVSSKVVRAFSFSDTPSKIKKTFSSVFRSPFQTSQSQQSLNEQKSVKLASMVSLQLTPTILDSKRSKLMRQECQSSQVSIRNHKYGGGPITSSMLSLNTCGIMHENLEQLQEERENSSGISFGKKVSTSSLESTNSSRMNDTCMQNGQQDDSSCVVNMKPPRHNIANDVTNLFQTSSGGFKRQFS